MTEKSQFWEDLKSGRFLSMVREASKGQYVFNSREVYNVMRPLFAEHDDVECVYSIFLDAKNRILGIEKMFTGSISASTVYPRELVKRIIALRATAIVLTHNHPSGCTQPSLEDKSITLKIGLLWFKRNGHFAKNVKNKSEVPYEFSKSKTTLHPRV